MEGEDERAALQHAVAQICTDEMQDGTSMTKGAVQTLTELAYMYATTCLSNDLVAFAQHANRRTITSDDIMLVARKNPNDLIRKLKEFAEANDCSTQSLLSTRKNLTDKKITTPTTSKISRKTRDKQETLIQDTESDCSSRDLSKPKKIVELHLKSSSWNFSDTDDDSEALLEMKKPTSTERYKAHEKLSRHGDHTNVYSKGGKRKNGMIQRDISSTDEEDDPPLSTLKKSRFTRARESPEKEKKRTKQNLDILLSSEEESAF